MNKATKILQVNVFCNFLGFPCSAAQVFGVLGTAALSLGGWCLMLPERVKKVNCTLVQTLKLCTGPVAHSGSRGIALLFHDHGTRRGVRGQRHVPAVLYPRERPSTHCTGGWVGPRAGLDRCEKSRPHRDSIPGPSSP